MLTLDIAPQQQALIEQASKEAGMNVEDYIIQQILPDSQQTEQTDRQALLEKLGKQLDSALEEEMKVLTHDDVFNKPNVWYPNEKESKIIADILERDIPPNENLKAILSLGQDNACL